MSVAQDHDLPLEEFCSPPGSHSSHVLPSGNRYELDATETIDAGEGRVVVVHDERGRGKGSGVQLARRWAVIFTVRRGTVVRFQTFKTRQDAREAAGLAE
jgi:hypothetical protein